MERKNYLCENLTEEEIKYVRGIIWKSARKCRRDDYKRKYIEGTSIDDENISEKVLMVEDKYNFLDRILVSENKELRPYTQAEQCNIVKALDNIACESGLSVYVEQLTFKEKLVVFLLYESCYRVNEVAKLLDIDRTTVTYRDNCIKEKIRRMKGIIKNGK